MSCKIEITLGFASSSGEDGVLGKEVLAKTNWN